MNRRTFGKSPDQFIEEFLCAYLEVERVSAVFDAYIEELRYLLAVAFICFSCDTDIECQHGDIGVPVVDIVDDGYGGFSWTCRCQCAFSKLG
jgi:hypothetical protein